MKPENLLTVFLLCIFLQADISAQSTMLFDAGTVVEVTGTADICADQIIINGGSTGNGKKCGGALPLRTFTSIPFLESFDYSAPPGLPTGWYLEDANNDAFLWVNGTTNPHSAPNLILYPSGTEAVNDWFFSPAFDLLRGTTYEVSFWYAVSSSGSHKLEVKTGLSGSSSGMTSGQLFVNEGITNLTHQRGVFTYSPSATGTYYFGWRCYSEAGNKPDFGVDDIQVRHQPEATNTQTLAPNSTAMIEFTGTGAYIQFTSNSSGELQIQADKINHSPGGTLPSGVTNVLSRYWTFTTVSGTVSGVYCLSLNLEGASGISDYATLHLLKRDNVNEVWTDIGVPSDISQAPLIRWCSEQLTGFSEFGIGGGTDNPLPVELQLFKASVKKNSVSLIWSTVTEVDNYGFEIQRAEIKVNQLSLYSEWQAIGFVAGSGNSNAPKEYQFPDKNLAPGKYAYRLKQIDADGSFDYSKSIEVVVSRPEKFLLEQNYPNPFNPLTKIDYQLPSEAFVSLELFSASGERRAVLINTTQPAGYYTVVIDNGILNLPSGVYIYRLTAGSYTGIKKFIIMK